MLDPEIFLGPDVCNVENYLACVSTNEAENAYGARQIVDTSLFCEMDQSVDDSVQVNSVLENYFTQDSLLAEDSASDIDSIHELWRVACGNSMTSQGASLVKTEPESHSAIGLHLARQVRIEGFTPVQTPTIEPQLTRRQRVERYLVKKRQRKSTSGCAKKQKPVVQRRRSTFVRPRVNGRFTDAREFVSLADLE